MKFQILTKKLEVGQGIILIKVMDEDCIIKRVLGPHEDKASSTNSCKKKLEEALKLGHMEK